MTRLNQIIAIEKDTRTRSENAAALVYHQLQKPEPLTGIRQDYEPTDAEGEIQPSKGNLVQLTVEGSLRTIARQTARVLDLTGAKERTNQEATADVMLGEQVFIEKAPVTLLLALQRQLEEELVQIRRLPTHDPKHTWHSFDGRGVYESDPIVTKSTKRVMKNHVKAVATDRHPEQVETYTEDTTVGLWTTKHYTGSVSVAAKADMLDRVITLIEAVKFAREQANMTQVVDFPVGSKIMTYLYG